MNFRSPKLAALIGMIPRSDRFVNRLQHFVRASILLFGKLRYYVFIKSRRSFLALYSENPVYLSCPFYHHRIYLFGNSGVDNRQRHRFEYRAFRRFACGMTTPPAVASFTRVNGEKSSAVHCSTTLFGGLKLMPKKSHRVSIRFVPSERKMLKEMSEEYDCSEAEVIRWAIRYAQSVRFQVNYLDDLSVRFKRRLGQKTSPFVIRLGDIDLKRIKDLWPTETSEMQVKVVSAVLVYRARVYDKCHTKLAGNEFY